jgi:hypothetical protein
MNIVESDIKHHKQTIKFSAHVTDKRYLKLILRFY